jgi:hypothetical protein
MHVPYCWPAIVGIASANKAQTIASLQGILHKMTRQSIRYDTRTLVAKVLEAAPERGNLDYRFELRIVVAPIRPEHGDCHMMRNGDRFTADPPQSLPKLLRCVASSFH